MLVLRCVHSAIQCIKMRTDSGACLYSFTFISDLREKTVRHRSTRAQMQRPNAVVMRSANPTNSTTCVCVIMVSNHHPDQRPIDQVMARSHRALALALASVSNLLWVFQC